MIETKQVPGATIKCFQKDCNGSKFYIYFNSVGDLWFSMTDEKGYNVQYNFCPDEDQEKAKEIIENLKKWLKDFKDGYNLDKWAGRA